MVEVDTETGKVTMLRHVAVDDCGRILNPLLVAGQQHGGIAQGAAQALYEWVQYDEDGNPLTSNLMDYAIPSAAELCSFEVSNTETPSPRNPLGAKGIGESGTIGSTPAIHNAVIDAVRHLGVTHIDMPCTSERVWQAIQAAVELDDRDRPGRAALGRLLDQLLVVAAGVDHERGALVVEVERVGRPEAAVARAHAARAGRS